MYSRLVLSFLVSLILRGCIAAQQLPNISFYRHNWTLINPAAFPREYIEMGDMNIITNINARSQRHKVVKGAPRAVDARAELIFGGNSYKDQTDNKVAFGLHAEEAGAIKELKAQLGYSWMTPLGTKKYEMGYLSIGGSVDYNNKRANTNEVNWLSPGEVPPYINTNYASFNIGAFYYIGTPHNDDMPFKAQVENRPYTTPYGFVGLSWSQPKAFGSTSYLQQKSHLNLLIGGVLHRVEPSLWVRYAPGLEFQSLNMSLPFVADFNLRYIYKIRSKKANKSMSGNQFWLGTGLSTAATMNIEAGYRDWVGEKSRGKLNTPNYYQIAFAYTGFRLSSLAIPRPNDFEVNLSWNFAKYK